ncbi:MAG: glycine cleavage T C-terminal barrel domain-containing protein, partial [Paracoccaceae bacterium]
PSSDRFWPISSGEKIIGRISSSAWSPDFQTNVAIGMVRMTHWDPGTQLTVLTPDGPRSATIQEKFWN